MGSAAPRWVAFAGGIVLDTTLRRGAVCALLALVFLTTTALAQQPESLTLERAVAIALEKNPVRKAALAETRAARSMTQEARSAFMPRLQFTESVMRSNDPVFVFGAKLRQQRFTQTDFALPSLNRPTPLNDISSRFSGQWALFDSGQNVLSWKRAKLMAEASSQHLERADQELVFRVVQAYYASLLAARQLQVAEQSLKTAESIEQRSRTRVENGLAVESDLLSAQVQTASRRQAQIRARNDAALARVQLAIALGLSADTEFTLAQHELPVPPLPFPADIETKALASRPDLKQARTQEAAQGTSVTLAKAAFGPRLNAIGSWQTDSRSLAWNGGNNWTAGVELQLDLFSGGAKLAQLNRERANQERAAAMRQAFEDNVRLEVRRAYYDADAARQQLEVARAAIAQAEESLRIQQNRYEAGLSTLTDLLRVEEASNRAQTDYWDAVYRSATSYAALELASGTLTPSSPVVKQ